MFAKRTVISLCCCILWVCFSSCSLRAIKEAEAVVAQADSLWRNGQRYEDSVSLAEAYNTLHQSPITNHQLPISNHHSPSYAHSCYHYGRLLRDHDDPVSAMQVFINASHSRTHDYHILGRVYSNMGSICHLANEFQLSYDMYSRSANMFLRNGDTLLYYYGLNNMAYELAEQGKELETLAIIDSIIKYCNEENVISKTWETKAELYYQTAQYESSIDCVNQLNKMGNNETTGTLIKAQAFSLLELNDSALLYANMVLTDVYASSQNKFNALYVLTHNDSTLYPEKIRDLTSQREDIRYYEYEPEQEKLNQAVQLLEQDLNKKPDMRWIYTLIAVVLFSITIVFIVYLFRKRKLHQQIIEDLHIKEQEQTRLSNDINTLSLLQEERHSQILAEIEEACKLYSNRNDIKTQLCWYDYDKMCEVVNQHLFGLVRQLEQFHFSEKEIRLCVLVVIKATTDDMVDLIPYAKSGLGKFKYTTAAKLGTSTPNMRSFLLNLLC